MVYLVFRLDATIFFENYLKSAVSSYPPQVHLLCKIKTTFNLITIIDITNPLRGRIKHIFLLHGQLF